MNQSTLLLKVISIAFLFSSCIDAKNDVIKTKEGNQISDFHEPSKSAVQETKKRPISYFPIKYPEKNMLMALMPISSDWKFSDNKKELVGRQIE